MQEFNNVILILIILFLLNYLKYVPSNKNKINKNKINKNKINKNNEIINKKDIVEKMTFGIPHKDLLYGKDQYIIKSNNNNKKLYYQNLEILKPTNIDLKFKYEVDNNIVNKNKLLDINHFDSRNLANQVNKEKPKILLSNEEIIANFNKETKNAIINTPIYDIKYPDNFNSSKIPINTHTDQKILYDYRFLDMHKDNLENLIHNDNNNLNEGKTIKEVYDNLIFDYKKINQKKNPITKNIKIDGAFGESSLPVDQWYYDDEINELSFDPTQSLEVAVPSL